jgi:hypothetical protein
MRCGTLSVKRPLGGFSALQIMRAPTAGALHAL